MSSLQNFHPRAFEIAGNDTDLAYYTAHPHLSLMDVGGYKAVETLYHTFLQEGDTILDLMCGRNSHLPNDIPFQKVIGLDISKEALQENPILTKQIVEDINQSPQIPLPDESINAICLCCTFEYLRKPQAIFKESFRILKPGGCILITFTDRFLPIRATALWQALNTEDRQRLIYLLLEEAGFVERDKGEVHPPTDHKIWKDTVYSVIGRKS